MIKRYRIFITLVIIFGCIFSGVFFLYSIRRVNEIYIDEFKDSIIQIKKTFLEDTVNNLIEEIEVEKNSISGNFKVTVDKKYEQVQFLENLSDEKFLNEVIRIFETENHDDYWTFMVWNINSNEILYDANDIFEQSWDGSYEKINEEFLSYREIENTNYKCLFGIKNEYINEIIKGLIIENVRYAKFSEDSYIWINQVINYNGGDDYAFRVVHPNLPDTEGEMLSTNTTDGYGSYPYKEELEGVKENGEIFYDYYFKKLKSDIVSEKITFSKLYEEFDWIISMGVYLDEVDVYINNSIERSRELTSKLILVLFFAFIIIIVASFSIVLYFERRHLRHSKRELEVQINIDELTKADSRKSGAKDLADFFEKFKYEGINPALILLDIDDFKEINDNYGHFMGDKVLIEVVKKISEFIRVSDRLIRWGGDEFVGVFYGLEKQNALSFCNRILNEISKMTITNDNISVQVTVSIGVSYFKKEDKSYLDALKRTDEAMYESKKQGRNTASIK